MPAARTEPRLIEISPSLAARCDSSDLIAILPQRGGGRVPFTEAELTAMAGV